MATDTYKETNFADMHPHMQDAIVRRLQATNPNDGYVANLAAQKATPPLTSAFAR
jgi:ubiquinone biosynthesis protein COQ9